MGHLISSVKVYKWTFILLSPATASRADDLFYIIVYRLVDQVAIPLWIGGYELRSESIRSLYNPPAIIALPV